MTDTRPFNEPGKSTTSNKSVRETAEQTVIDRGGRLNQSDEVFKRQVDEEIRKLEENDKQTKEWAQGSNILGDV